MGFKVKIQEVNIETVQKGRNSYQVAHVNYLYNGEAKTTKLMSFSNPAVYKAVNDNVGKTVEVETTRNGQYTNWSQVTPVAASDDAPAARTGAPGAASGRSAPSTYETAEERKIKQLYIIKQSSIGAAISTLTPGSKSALNPNEVLAVAQQYVDFVYGNRQEDILKMDSDIEDLSN